MDSLRITSQLQSEWQDSGLSFRIMLVGESGQGKSTFTRALLRSSKLTRTPRASVRTGCAYQPPACCTYQKRRAAGAPPYVRCTRTSLRRALRTAYRGTTGERVEVAEKGRLLTQEEKEREKVVEAARSA